MNRTDKKKVLDLITSSIGIKLQNKAITSAWLNICVCHRSAAYLNRRFTREAFRRHLMFESLEYRQLLATTDLASIVSPLISPSRTAMSGAILDSPQGDSSLRMQSSDGRYLVFVSNSQNLVAVGTLPPGMQQVYRYDRVNHEVVLVSVASDGVNGGNGKSDSPTISADGTRVAFRSEATNLNLMDQDNYPDIYVRELGNQPNTILASVNNAGTSKGNSYSFNPRISANGSRVVFHSYSSNIDPMDADANSDIYVRDLELPATFLASVNADGTIKGNNTSQEASISADGTRIAFSSYASNLDPLDQDNGSDIYVRELDDTPTTILVSVNGEGTVKGNGSSESPVISANGKRVAFESSATNFDPLDRDPIPDVYVRTLIDVPATTLVNVNANGTYKSNSGGYWWPSGLSISADGTRIAFITLGRLDPLDLDQLWDVYVRDIGDTPTTFLASVDSSGTVKGNRSSYYPVISDDGTRVAYASDSSNLDPRDSDTLSDIYVRELDVTPRTVLASGIAFAIENDFGSSKSLSISGDGTKIAFASDGSNIVSNDFNQASDVVVYSVDTEKSDLASMANPMRPALTSGPGADLNPSIQSSGVPPTNSVQHMWSADGRYLVFLSTAANLVAGIVVPEGIQQVYRYDQITHQTILVSIGVNGVAAGNQNSDSPTISADGTRIAFRSLANNLHPLDTDNISDIFVRELDGTPSTLLASVNTSGTTKSNGYSSQPIISANGEKVAFVSNATNIDPMDKDLLQDVYVRDLIAPFQTILASVSDDGNTKGNSSSDSPSISANGTRIAFSSSASNLHPLDTDPFYDIFVREVDSSPKTILASVNAAGDKKGDFFSESPTISADGKRVAYLSRSTNLDPRDRNPNDDVYVRVLEPIPTTFLASGPGLFNMDSDSVSISADGMRVAFATGNSLVPLDPYRNFDSDVYVRELDGSDRIILVTVNAAGTEKANSGGILPRISADGNRVVYVSASNNLDPQDTDNLFDVFVRELDVTPATYLASINQDGTAKGNSDSTSPSISADGSRVAFVSLASNLIAGDWNGKNDVFVRELPPHRWQNPRDRYDVDEDGLISPLDVLVLVNDINQFSTRILPSETPAGPKPPPYLDVDGDDYVSPLDVLLVINYLNAQVLRLGSGEGERGEANPQECIKSLRTRLIDIVLSAESWREELVSSRRSRLRNSVCGPPIAFRSFM